MKHIKVITALIFMTGFFACKDVDVSVINIYHTSGTGGMYAARTEPVYENQEVGGYAVLKNFYEKEQGKKILFDGGDWFTKTQEGTVGGIPKALELMQMTGYAASGVSYADLGAGWGTVSQQLRGSKMPLLSANLKDNKGEVAAPLFRYIIREVGGIKLGVFSVVVKNSISGPHTRLNDINITDEIAAAKDMVELLKEKEVDLIIMIVDIAENADNYDEKIFAEEVEGIDIILGSAVSGEPGETYKFKDVNIVKTEPYLASVSKIRLTLNKEKEVISFKYENMPLYKDRYGENEEIKKVVDDLRQTTHKRYSRSVAENMQDLEDIDSAPSELGEIVADCIRTWAKTDIAIMNSDSLRSSLKKGTITEYNLYELYPYLDTVMTVRVRGGELKNLLEKSIISKNNFPQISGMEVTYDPTGAQGKKIKSIKIKGVTPGENTIYRLATTDHIVAGGFGHDDFVNVVEFKNTQVEVRSILRQCLSRKKKITPPAKLSWIPLKPSI
ncbi:2'(,)3'-cyclic-nucleotide 2'-phosphodiesterase [Elusimicrobium posterum]|uniref:bifunctional metallophosphatase/5'-nucleotidase n=1 Tax=Elusimicrobium posterum TaxID=3116653 RepID=UPI003C731480